MPASVVGPIAENLLSGLPSWSRSKPSVSLPIASFEMTWGCEPANATIGWPSHSGFGVNSGARPGSSSPHADNATTASRPAPRVIVGELEHDQFQAVNAELARGPEASP